jgi:hypothetical protein
VIRAGAALVLLLAGLLAGLLSGCGDTGPSGTSNVQGGTGRAPGAPPAGAQVSPTAVRTPTVAR